MLLGVPSQLKTRRYGGWSNRHQQSYRKRCEALLNADATGSEELCATVAVEADPLKTETPDDACCPHCGTPMPLQTSTDRPSWRLLLSSAARPIWYESG